MKLTSASSAVVLFMALVVGCEQGSSPVEFAGVVVESLSARDALATANRWRTSEPGVSSSLTFDAVKFTLPDGNKVSVDLPSDTMVVAVAPYISTTHPCGIHSISGCSGELMEELVQVVATSAGGTVLIDKTMTTTTSGFLELWLPRGQQITLVLEAQGRRVEGTITTYDASNTCVTTFRLK